MNEKSHLRKNNLNNELFIPFADPALHRTLPTRTSLFWKCTVIMIFFFYKWIPWGVDCLFFLLLLAFPISLFLFPIQYYNWSNNGVNGSLWPPDCIQSNAVLQPYGQLTALCLLLTDHLSLCPLPQEYHRQFCLICHFSIFNFHLQQKQKRWIKDRVCVGSKIFLLKEYKLRIGASGVLVCFFNYSRYF